VWRGYDDVQPSWSPDGERIAFVSNRSGRWQIYIVDRDGLNVRSLTRTATRDAHPAWSPDGEKVAYCTIRFGFWSICVVEVQKALTQVLTNNPAAEECPAWSPDGSKIAYHSNRTGGYSIWVCNPDGSKQTQLTSGRSSDLEPAWSPDGKSIAFRSNREDPNKQDTDGSESIWVMDADGKNLRQLTRGAANHKSPAWSPDGKQIAFVTEAAGSRTLWVMDADGSNQREVIALGTACENPAWMPGDNILAFEANPSGAFRIQTVTTDGISHTELAAQDPKAAAARAPESIPPQGYARARHMPPPTAQPAAPTSRRYMARQSGARMKRGLASNLLRLALLAGVAVGLYYGINWLLGSRTVPILVDKPQISQEETDCSVTYTIRNGGKAGLIRAKVTVVLDNGERVQSGSPLQAYRFGRGEEKTFTDKFVVRSDRIVKDADVQLFPKPK
jgi:TolB protein